MKRVTLFLVLLAMVLLTVAAIEAIELATVTLERDTQTAIITSQKALIDELEDQRDAAQKKLAAWAAEAENESSAPAAVELAAPVVPDKTETVVATQFAEARAEEPGAVIDRPCGARELGTFEISHYCTCAKCCGKETGITASGRAAVAGYTIAVDPKVIPLGSTVYLDYGDGAMHECRADDTGGAIKGTRIDVCVADHETALQLGMRTATVYVAPGEK